MVNPISILALNCLFIFLENEFLHLKSGSLEERMKLKLKYLIYYPLFFGSEFALLVFSISPY